MCLNVEAEEAKKKYTLSPENCLILDIRKKKNHKTGIT